MHYQLIGVGFTLCLVACSGTEEASSSANRESTKEAQVALVKELEPAVYKSRLRRVLDAPASFDVPVAYPPYDFSGTDAERESNAQRATIQDNLAKSDWSPEPAAGKTRVIFTDVEHRTEWEQEYDFEDLEVIWEIAQRIGLNKASDITQKDSEPEIEPPGAMAQAWSGAHDSRQPKPINGTYGVFHNTLSRMGQLNRGCTGTLVGRRLVLTAAHCVVQPNLSQVNQQYRNRGSSTNEPYGVVNTAAYWWDSAYDANNCHNVYTSGTRETCGRYDWALLLLPDNAWSASPNGTPAWMGYWVPGSTDMQNHAYSWIDGYPGCNLSDSPANCTTYPNTAFGELSGRTSRLFRGADTSGQLAIFQTANDISPGESGAAVFSTIYPDSAGGPYVLAVETNELCGTCVGQSGTTLSHPTMVRRITSWVGGFISTQRTNFP